MIFARAPRGTQSSASCCNFWCLSLFSLHAPAALTGTEAEAMKAKKRNRGGRRLRAMQRRLAAESEE
eukprot:812859-Pelagomonas_calceolata.AAC.1